MTTDLSHYGIDITPERVIWSPQPKQREFLSRGEYEVLYGGAAGGGKSDAAIMIPLSQVHIPHFKALILRKTFPQLSELIDKSIDYYKRAFPGAKYNTTAHRWTFPSGATVTFGSMHRRQDRENYRGKQYDVIIFDELTHFTWEEYSFMFSRNRPSGPGTFVCMRATTNPGGIGHGWVKQRFIDAAPPLTPVIEDVRVPNEKGELITLKRSRVFVPAKVYDNQALLRNDPMYVANLSMLSESERKAQLEGSWDSFSGQVFVEWRNDPEHYRDQRWTHVIEPFRIPSWWRIYRGFDFGFAKPFSVGWFAVDGDGRMYHIREYYGTSGAPDVGAKLEPHQIAEKIKQIEREDENLKGRDIIGIADPSIFDESRGESIAAMMERPHFVTFGKGDNHRIPGKMQFHYRLAFDTSGVPMFYVFDTCKHFIRTVPALVYSESDVEDVDTKQEDHIYDMTRYVMMENPIASRKNVLAPRIPADDPLDLRERAGKYDFFRV